MPQLILNSQDKEHFKSFVINCEEDVIPQLSWSDLFDIVSKKYNIDKNVIYFKTHKCGKIFYTDQEILNTENFRMTYEKIQEKNNDYWFSFGIQIRLSNI